jgi:sterol desaturase/sphingolipid hydroxylase (fatty acid hydroxylase superfamily)
MNSILFAFIFVTITSKCLAFIQEKQLGLASLFSFLPFWLNAILLIILYDVWMYIWHRANHEIGFLWRFHRMHHSDPEMNVTTALRFHTGELFLSSFLRLIIFTLLGMNTGILLIYESMMMPVIYFHHSNIRISHNVDRILRAIIMTPWLHWVHHSNVQKETDTNYGTIFTWWDRIAKTFYLREDPENIELGLVDFKVSTFQTLWGMLKTPFISVKQT